MVHIIKADRGPRVEIHAIERTVHGNGTFVKVYGELKIAAKEVVYAREMKLNSIEVLVLTPLTGAHFLFHVQKWIYSKGTYDNYASIDIFVPTGTVNEMMASGRGQVNLGPPAVLPEDGSIWLDFIAMGDG